jgi:hypothetical protein
LADTSTLIGRLVADAKPVKRLRPPTLRACLWLLAAGSIAGVAILLLANLPVFAERIAEPALAIEWVATLMTGAAAVLAAFQLSLPDRSPAWALLPLPSLAVWIGSSGYSCYRHWITVGPAGWQLGPSVDCLVFILAVSPPVALSLLVVLRRARPLDSVRVAGMGALGVAALAAAALQFFHPFDVTFIDLGVHLGAVALMIAGVSAAEHISARALANRARMYPSQTL